MAHPNRTWAAADGNYRYGFNGVEKEGEVYGKGNMSAMDFRMYDPRVGRWWGVDKIVKVHESLYAAFFNNPINYADPSGLEGENEAVYDDRSKSGLGPDGKPMNRGTSGGTGNQYRTNTPPVLDPEINRSFQRRMVAIQQRDAILRQQQVMFDRENPIKPTVHNNGASSASATLAVDIGKVSTTVGWANDVGIGIPASLMGEALGQVLASEFPSIANEEELLDSFTNSKKMSGGKVSKEQLKGLSFALKYSKLSGVLTKKQLAKLNTQLSRYRALSAEIDMLGKLGQGLIYFSFANDMANALYQGSLVKSAHAVLNLAVGLYTASRGLTWVGIAYTVLDKVLGGQIETHIQQSLFSWRIGMLTENTGSVPSDGTQVFIPLDSYRSPVSNTRPLFDGGMRIQTGY